MINIGITIKFKMKVVKLTYQILYTVWIFMVCIDVQLNGVYGANSAADVQRYLELGIQMLARGQLHDALAQFHAAIDGDPNNYLSYYRRATVFLALGRGKLALQDLNKVMELKPEMVSAQMQRAQIYYKMGDLDVAHIDLEQVLRKDENHKEASELYTSLEPLKQKITIARDYMDRMDYQHAIPLLNEIVDLCPWAAWAREMRITAHDALGDYQSAVTDLRVTTKLTADNTAGFLKLSTLYYKMGGVEQALGEVRECLKLDPDEKDCFTLYKKVKKIFKQLQSLQEHYNNDDHQECSNYANKMLKEEKKEAAVRQLAFEKLCTCERENGNHADALTACDEAINHTKDPRLYCERAELHIHLDDFDEATHDFQKALDIDENFHKAKEGIERVQKLKKQANRRDYYKILGVKRSATKREITKAYRKMAQTWHPDRYDGEEKKKAEKKFIDIAAAKEVLTNPEMREKFDNGEDPLDPEQQQGGRQHPFANGFNPFQHFQGGGPGGGNFHFKFNF